MTAQDLMQKGYKQYGYWFIKENLSVNLFTCQIKNTNNSMIFSFFYDKNKINIDKIEEIYKLINDIQ